MKAYPSRLFLPLAALGCLLCFVVVFHTPALAAVAVFNLAVAGLAAADLLASARVDRTTFSVTAPAEMGVGREGVVGVRWLSPLRRPVRAQMRLKASPAVELGSLFFDFVMPPAAEVTVESPLKAVARGTARIGGLRFRHRSRFGLWVLEVSPEAECRVEVVPDIEDLKSRGLLIPLIQKLESGFKRTTRPDQEGEFDSLIKYEPGMDLRKIDWKASARNRRMLSRKFTLEQNHHVYLAFDTGRLMGTRTGDLSKLDLAINSALKLAFLALKTGDNVGLVSFDDDLRTFMRSAKGPAHFLRLVKQANELKASAEEANYNRAFHLFARHQLRRSLLVVFTDFIDRVSATLLLEALSYVSRRHLVLFVSFQDTEIREKLFAAPEDLQGLHERNEIFRLLAERRQVLKEMQRMNISTIDADPSELTVSLLNRYLELKASQRL